MDTDEQPLVARARAGDRQAFRALVEAHSPRVFQLVWRITGDEQLAEDAVQETFLNAWRKLGGFRGDARFSTWLHRIAVNAALGLVRKRKRTKETSMEVEQEWTDMAGPDVNRTEPRPDEVLGRHELGEATQRALGQLSRLERHAFVLRHFEEMTIREIGLAMDMSDGSIKQALFRAVRKVRAVLDPVVMRHETS